MPRPFLLGDERLEHIHAGRVVDARRAHQPFVIRFYAVDFTSAVIHDEGDGVTDVRSEREGSGMIGGDEHFETLFAPFHFGEYRSDDERVYKLDGADLSRLVALMSALVGRFHVQIYEVIVPHAPSTSIESIPATMPRPLTRSTALITAPLSP